MPFRHAVRRWHRRLSVLIGIQLLFWTASGLVFAILPIEEVRGEHLLAEGAPQLRAEDAAPMSEAEARDAALRALTLDAAIESATLLDEAPNEFRGKPLPAWRIDFDDATSLYLDPVTAEVHAVRTDTWRLFDFFWMLHIMDYDERQDFNHPLLIVAASFGVLTSLTGLTLAFLHYRRRIKA